MVVECLRAGDGRVVAEALATEPTQCLAARVGFVVLCPKYSTGNDALHC